MSDDLMLPAASELETPITGNRFSLFTMQCCGNCWLSISSNSRYSCSDKYYISALNIYCVEQDAKIIMLRSSMLAAYRVSGGVCDQLYLVVSGQQDHCIHGPYARCVRGLAIYLCADMHVWRAIV